MRTNIRQSVFETNSSSVHALVRMSMSEYNEFFKNARGYFSAGMNKFIPKEQVQVEHKKWVEEKRAQYGDDIPSYLLEYVHDIDYWAYENEYYNYSNFDDNFEAIEMESEDKQSIYVSIYGNTN